MSLPETTLDDDLGPWCIYLGPNVTPELIRRVVNRVRSIPGPTSTASLRLFFAGLGNRPLRDCILVETFTPAVTLGCSNAFTVQSSASHDVRVTIKAQGKPQTLPGLLQRYARELANTAGKLQAQKLRGPRQKASRDQEVAECLASVVALQALAAEVADELRSK